LYPAFRKRSEYCLEGRHSAQEQRAVKAGLRAEPRGHRR
jgi:hypothetical protein